jgi:8-oxo-dGTP pyrophosphatase MutT (NUDIX family)
MRRAAGFILMLLTEEGRRFLLLRNAKHGTWSVPKGHLEANEDELAGAQRELLEETGISAVRIVPGFREVQRYRVAAGKRADHPEGYEKEVVLFLAIAPSPQWQRSSEHDTGAWVDLSSAGRLVSHDALRQALAKAATFPVAES